MQHQDDCKTNSYVKVILLSIFVMLLHVWNHHCLNTCSCFELKCIWRFGWSLLSRGVLILIWSSRRIKLSLWCWPTLSLDDSPPLREKCKAPCSLSSLSNLCFAVLFFAGSCVWIGASLWPPDEGAQRDIQVPELQDRYVTPPSPLRSEKLKTHMQPQTLTNPYIKILFFAHEE